VRIAPMMIVRPRMAEYRSPLPQFKR